MCGIAGIVRLADSGPVDERLLLAMNDQLSHRGPDGSGLHVEDGVGLAHRRLSIIDLAGGRQPLYNEDRSVVVTYNGEIYNFAELVRELTLLGHTFATRSDTEVIVHAWEQWGEECLHRFNGMFAFALWDARRRTLFLARDRLGVKPLYYAWIAGGTLVFGSELKALLRCGSIPRTICPQSVEDYFSFGYVPDPRTIYEHVWKLEPGCYLKLVRGAPPAAPVRYWDVPLWTAGTAPGKPEDWADELRERLRGAVAARLVSDVPLGAFLSGGVDSSAVVATMRGLGVRKLVTCSIGFTEAEYDESPHARRVAELVGSDHRTEVVSAADESLVESLIRIYDEPFADSSAIPTFQVCALARRHLTVALSGDGGDEDFIGYRRYRLFAAEQAIRSRIPESVRSAIFGPLGAAYPKLDWAPRMFRAKTTLEALARSASEAYLHGVGVMPEEQRRGLYSRRLARDLQGYRSHEVFARSLQGKSFPDPLSMVQYLDYRTYLPGDILTKVDRASMAHGLEVRVPFLDYTLVEWAASLPASAKYRRGEGKFVLKRAMAPVLPAQTLYRAKKGFAVPMDRWFHQSLRQKMDDAIRGAVLRDSGLFEPERLELMWRQHCAGIRNHSASLWAILMFERFLRDGAVAGSARPLTASAS